ncbi:ADP-ribosyltransferase [Streptomyces phage Marky]|nr:ADP-ribosyltransferase [Streptomyces phage Marky]
MGSSAPLGTKSLFNTPGASLPGYVREIARELMKKGKTKSEAVQMAIGICKRWAAEGKPKAVEAIRQWEAAKAKAHATPNKSDLSNPVYAPGNVVLLAAPKKESKKDGEKRKEAGKLPPGATGWKHGWIPVDDSGKAVGPSQKPQWLKDAEAKHKAAGGRDADTIQKEKAQAEFKARAEKAAAPAKKAKAEAEAKAKKATAAKKRAAAEAERKKKAADRASEQKTRERDTLIGKAYKQALSDRKAGRELSEQQRRVVAHVEAQQKKDANKLRGVDVPGADGSKVAKKTAAKKTTAKKTTAKAKAGVAKAAAKKATGTATANTVNKSATVVRARSFTSGQQQSNRSRRQGGTVRLSNPYAPWDEGGGVNEDVLDFANMPKGQLAFRYKHGWILINPAIPSRGRMGGGLAKQHGHKSGSVTHGHFEPGAGGKGKKFVPDRSGGENNPAKLKAAHAKTKPIASAPNDKTKYGLTAAELGKGNALKPSTPSPEKVAQVSKDANAASVQANKTKSLADAQVAAKKHADAFVQAKKAGNDPLAQSHKSNAQAWAKKAAQIKTAEKASADAKAKYEAEQKAKAAEDKAKAEKAQADLAKKAAEKKAAEEKAKKEAEEKEAAEKKAAAVAANKLGTDAFDVSETADAADTPWAHKQAAKKHAEAAKAFQGVGQAGDAKMHAQKSVEHLKKAKDLESPPPAAPKAQTKPDTDDGMDLGQAVGDTMDEIGAKAPGLAQWDDYLFASAQYKKNPTPANLKKMSAAQAALKQKTGVSTVDIQDANKILYGKLGLLPKPAAKKTVAQKKAEGSAPTAKKTAAKKTAAPKPPTPEADEDKPTPEMLKEWEVTLPGPGMFKDGNAIMMLMNKPTTSPAQDAAKSAAVQKALAEFQSKHGKAFDPNNVEVDLYQNLHGGGAAVPQLKSDFFKDAEAAGFNHPAPGADVTNGWKPPAKTKAALLGYTGEGSYSYVPINGQLRTVSPDGYPVPQTDPIRKRINLMDEAFAAAPPLPGNIVTVRKMKNNGQFPGYPPPMTEGDEYVDYGYGSTSKSTSGWSGKVVMEVRIPAGTRVLDVNHNGIVSCSTSEQEILLPRGVRYRVVKDEMIGGQRRITTEIVGSGETHPNVKL